MKNLLVYPPALATRRSCKHVLRFVSKRAAFAPLALLCHQVNKVEQYRLEVNALTQTVAWKEDATS